MSINLFAVFVADYINRYYFMVLPPVGFVGNILSFLVSFRVCKSTRINIKFLRHFSPVPGVGGR